MQLRNLVDSSTWQKRGHTNQPPTIGIEAVQLTPRFKPAASKPGIRRAAPNNEPIRINNPFAKNWVLLHTEISTNVGLKFGPRRSRYLPILSEDHFYRWIMEMMYK